MSTFFNATVNEKSLYTSRCDSTIGARHKHGSWLNIIETLFSKMANTFLRHIRVESWDELKERILKGIAEINAAPVVHRWKNFDALTHSEAA